MQLADGLIEILQAVRLHSDVHILQVERQILGKLGGAVNALDREGKQYRVRVTGFRVCFKPPLNGRGGVSNVIERAAKLCLKTSVQVARTGQMLRFG